MAGTVYTVASGKGGVGKTTTSVNLAVALWREGRAVALVDADIGMANLAAVLDLEPRVTLHDVLAGEASIEDALVEAKDGDLLVLPGDRSLESFADADPGRLQAAVAALAERCEYVIVDTGAGLSYEDVLPLGMADGVLLVTTPDPAAFGDTRKTMGVADILDVPIRGLVVTRAVQDTDSAAIAGEIGAELLGTIPEDPAVMASTVAGNPLESHAPDSEAAGAYRDLADTILEGDPEWLESHAREPEAEASDRERTEEDEEPPGVGSIVTDVGEAGGTPADPTSTVGEAWAAANRDPVGEGESVESGVPADVAEDVAQEADEAPEEDAASDDGGPADEPDADATHGGGTDPEEAADAGPEDGDVADAEAAADQADASTADEGEPEDEAEVADEEDPDEAEDAAPAEEAAEDSTDEAAEDVEDDEEVAAESADEPGAGESDGDDGEPSDGDDEEAERRGGFFGWLGRRFS